MKVALIKGETWGVHLLAFISPERNTPNSFVVLNERSQREKLHFKFKGTGDEFSLYRTNDEEESYAFIKDMELKDDTFTYISPARSLSTFFLQNEE